MNYLLDLNNLGTKLKIKEMVIVHGLIKIP